MAKQPTTHILSANEQKHSLSGKKKLKKTTLRNVLGTPYANYWPLVTSEDEAKITDTLKKNLKQLKVPKVKVPYNIIKSIPKEERKAFRTAHIPQVSSKYRSQLVFGTNEVTKLLESNSASSVLVSAETEPKFLVKHVIDMCVLRKVPVLVVPQLKETLKESTGLASLTMAFKHNSDFVTIDNEIKTCSKSYPPSENHVNLSRTTEDRVTQMEVVTDSDDSDSNKSGSVYLYRKSKNERIFVPKLSVKRDSVGTFSQMDTKSVDFISFGNSSPSKEVKNVKVSYKSLLLKRVTGNKNRDKKKIEQLKMSK